MKKENEVDGYFDVKIPICFWWIQPITNDPSKH